MRLLSIRVEYYRPSVLFPPEADGDRINLMGIELGINVCVYVCVSERKTKNGTEREGDRFGEENFIH